MLSYLLFGTTYAFAAAMQPGAFQAYIISHALSKGWKRTLPSAFAPLLSDGPIIILVLLLLSQIPEHFIRFLHCAGGIFLLYLAARSLWAWRKADRSDKPEAQSNQRALLNAAFVNLLNPGPYLTWSLVLGPMLLKGWREAPMNGAAFLLSFYVTMVVNLVGIICVFSFARNLGPRLSQVLVMISSIALACFGVYQLWLGINTQAAI